MRNEDKAVIEKMIAYCQDIETLSEMEKELSEL